MTFRNLVAFIRSGFKQLPSKKILKKLTENDFENLQFRSQTAWPLYFKRGDFYYKMITPHILIRASLKSGSRGVVDLSNSHNSFLFRLWRNEKHLAKGFQSITEMMYHEVFSEATDQNNLLHRLNTQSHIQRY
ncbi:hypothetical protein AHMF7605_11985 [Adhaeribacter arboris]|uniref:Uncharacterized protein n=1 Tax=Adhaeribacter arboris TaxID=2072846 RepID=A0A2T2YFA3_9BACT|nr:hypothetical protein [Adhaeribacter arboris]PSR54190.1 hypothetical protein AHMF7605_11985 [Adhaeribacter arboris]